MSKEKPAGEVVSFPTPEGIKPEVESKEISAPTSEETSKEEEIPFVFKVVTEEDIKPILEAIKANVGQPFLKFSLEVERTISAISPFDHEKDSILDSVGIPENHNANLGEDLRNKLHQIFPGKETASHSGFIEAEEYCMSKRELAFFFRKMEIRMEQNPLRGLLDALSVSSDDED